MKRLAASLCAIGFVLIAFTGCSEQNFTEKTYQSGDSTIERIVIEATDRELEISASEDQQIHIDYFDSEKEYLDFDLSDNQLTVKLTFDKDWSDYIGFQPSAEYRKIKIRVPNDMIVDFSASTTNENITVTSLSFAQSVSLDSNGGSILCDRVNVGKSIDLTAKNGDITGTILGSLDEFSISCEIKKGDCNLSNKESGTKSFAANCNNGNINIEFVQ